MVKKPDMELDSLKDNKIVIIGKKLKVRWLDSYLLVWSGKEHPYDEE